jgi:hypothetical protein
MVRSLVLAILVATSLSAAPIGKVYVIPAAPTNLTPVVLTFEGKPVSAPVVRIDGSRIELHFFEADPTQSARPRQDTVLLGHLAAGNYDVIVTLGNSVVAQQFPLRVRDVTTIPFIFPWITKTRGAAVLEWTELSFPSVFIGGVRARYGRIDQYLAIYPTEALPAGLYDVEFRWFDGSVDVAKNAVEIVNSADDTPFGARNLVPVLFSGPGAYGTHWTTEYDFELIDFGYMSRSLDRNDHPRGWLFVPSPRQERRRRYYVRVQPEPNATRTPIPVVQETEFRPSFRINDIPTRIRQTVTLRVYSVEPANVTITTPEGFSRRVRTEAGGKDEPAFASVDLSRAFDQDSTDLILFADAPIWALASTFDPATREFHVRTP